jgi:RNA polymerase sigma-70 factor (ECF subfamily)
VADPPTGGEELNDPDPRLVSRARAGDLEAFEDLVRLYQADVWRFAYHLTRDRTMAEDVTQEAFLRAFRFLSTFRGDARFSSWLLRIVRNCGMDALRRRRSDQQREYPPPEGAPDPATRTELAMAVDALSQDHRQPFLLIEVFGLSYQEASDVLAVKVGTVKSRMHRARQALVKALSEAEAAEADEGGTGGGL